jgi:hypothetical protein
MTISEIELANLAVGFITAQATAIMALATTSDIGTKVMPALGNYAANGPPSLRTWPARVLQTALAGGDVNTKELVALLKAAKKR